MQMTKSRGYQLVCSKELQHGNISMKDTIGSRYCVRGLLGKCASRPAQLRKQYTVLALKTVNSLNSAEANARPLLTGVRAVILRGNAYRRQ